jgi:sigma54-dependent transcription regulator
MISCKEVATLMMSDQARTSSRWTRMQLRLHLAMCRYCSRLARQLRQLSIASRKLADAAPPDSSFEQRIIDRLSK